MERTKLCILFNNFKLELRSYLKLLTFSWGITNLTSKQPDSPTLSIPVELHQYRRSIKDTVISAKGDNCATDCLDLGTINKHCQRHYGPSHVLTAFTSSFGLICWVGFGMFGSVGLLG